MGAGLSKYEDYRLTSRVNDPVAIIDARFCLPDRVKLALQPTSPFGHDFKVTDEAGTKLFALYVNSLALFTHKSVLIDAYGDAVCNFKKDANTMCAAKFAVLRGGSDGSGEGEGQAMKVKADVGSFSITLYAETAKHGTLVVKGGVRDSCIFVFAGYPKRGGVLIAKAIRSSAMFVSADSTLWVAPGVDIAAMVALVAMMHAVERRVIKDRKKRSS
ncbi:hypothetical protein H9P43_005794 [Blastocladiella emersonii ATCC 22665]|nr:hypothetical protein H9P43_005794 [Blastocladiella emersonii ATCC 22665]